jgi:ribosome-binding factor A
MSSFHFYNKLKIKTLIERNVRNIVLLNTQEINFLSMNKIEINNDHSLVKIYVSFLNSDAKQAQKSLHLLEKKIPYFRSELAKKMSLYKTPNISFFLDQRFVINQKMNELLKKINK